MLGRWNCFTALTGLLVLLCVVGCGSGQAAPEASISGGNSGDGQVDSSSETVTAENDSSSTAQPTRQVNNYPEVLVETNRGRFTLQLDAKKAPRTVEHFLENHVAVDFYNGTVFHHVDDGRMIIGGGYTVGLEPKAVRGEVLNEADNGLKNTRGTIAMNRYPAARDSATCQFIINLAENTFLDHQSSEKEEDFGYCVFGKVIKGLEVVEQIAATEAEVSGDFPSTPVEPVVIQSMRRIK